MARAVIYAVAICTAAETWYANSYANVGHQRRTTTDERMARVLHSYTLTHEHGHRRPEGRKLQNRCHAQKRFH